jgi:hypothetical protein
MKRLLSHLAALCSSFWYIWRYESGNDLKDLKDSALRGGPGTVRVACLYEPLPLWRRILIRAGFKSFWRMTRMVSFRVEAVKDCTLTPSELERTAYADLDGEE